jgi:putative ABC transport system ATP-binding protein
MPLLELRHVNKTYNQRSDHPLTVLRDVSFVVEAGDFVSIMGPSGSGKSTLLNVLGLLDQPDSGEYFLGGRDMMRLPRRALPGVRAREIGFVFQTFNLLPRMSVFHNVQLPMVYAGHPAAERHKRAEEVLGLVHLTQRARHVPNQLSGGEQQRAAIARAVANDPPLILADEPTGNLDSANGRLVMEELSRLNAGGRTIILVTHDPAVAGYARHHYRMQDGVLSEDQHVD